MRFLVAQLNPTVGNLDGNARKIIQALDRARAEKIDVVLFPEMVLTGYPPEDLLLHHSFIEGVERYLEQIVAASKGLFAVVGLPRKNPIKGEKPLFNSVAIIQDGKLLDYYDKWLLPTYDVFDEKRYFEEGSKVGLWTYKGKKIGITICEDMWQHSGFVDMTIYSRDPIVELERLKPDIMLNLSGSPYHFQKPDLRMQVCAASTKTLQCPMLLCCQVGANDELVFDGYSACVDKDGKLLKVAKAFVEDEMIFDLDHPPKPITLTYDPLKDLHDALVLGIRDYFHKQGFKKGLIGVSGGIDSALVACLAVDALGKENVLGVAMPSRYSSPTSLKDAQDLAKNLGIKLIEVPIEEPFTEFLALLKPAFEGRPEDVTEENLQSRIRGTILMSLSNKLGYVVLSTGNKSEMAMGYATLYGDMVGGLAVISDVTKKQVYDLSRWINRNREIIPLSSIEKAPSAELKPNQKDTDSLPEYDIIDKIVASYVEDYHSPEEISTKYHYPIELVLDVIHRIHRAEYKRRQSAPGIRVSRKSFRIGRRIPIVQGWM